MLYYKGLSHKQVGFVLIELMAVLSIAAVLLSTWPMPFYQQSLQTTRLKLTGHRLFHTLQFARTAAMQGAVEVVVCPSTDGKSPGDTWEDGWIVYTPVEGVPHVLQVAPKLYPFQRLHWYGARHTPVVHFQKEGMSRGYNGHFVLCSKASKLVWLVFISQTGRIRYETSSDLSYCKC